MNFEKIKQTMTKEEFLEVKTGDCGCPSSFGLKNKNEGECCYITCKDCWSEAINSNGVIFKGDNLEEQNVIDALKVIKNYCDDKELCIGCKFNVFGKCMMNLNCPTSWNIKKLEDLIKSKVAIYKVEHSKGGKQYTFVSDEYLPIGIMVICDTKYGQSYGKIVDMFRGVDDGNKKCWRIKQ